MSLRPPKIWIAGDTAAFRLGDDGRLQILLIQRANEPFKGMWALPGGFVEEGEDLPDAAARELEEETGLRPAVMDQLGAWGTPGRDPRGRVVSAVYVAVAGARAGEVKGGDDAANAEWHSLDSLPALAFDHEEIVPAALLDLKRRCETTHLAFAFLGDRFCANDLGRALHGIGFFKTPQGAARLLAVADVEPVEGEFYRLSAASFLAPLREPVFLFSARGH